MTQESFIQFCRDTAITPSLVYPRSVLLDDVFAFAVGGHSGHRGIGADGSLSFPQFCDRLVRVAMIAFASHDQLTAKAKFSHLLQHLRKPCRAHYDVSLSIPPARSQNQIPRKAPLVTHRPFVTQSEAAARFAYGYTAMVAKMALRQWRDVVISRARLALIHARLMERQGLATRLRVLKAWQRCTLRQCQDSQNLCLAGVAPAICGKCCNA